MTPFSPSQTAVDPERCRWFRRAGDPEAPDVAVAVVVIATVMLAAGACRPTGDAVTPPGPPPPITIVKPTGDGPFDRTFTWRPVTGATAYRVEVSSSEGARLFEVRDVKGTGISLNESVNLATGRYVWQVFATQDGKDVTQSAATSFSIP